MGFCKKYRLVVLSALISFLVILTYDMYASNNPLFGFHNNNKCPDCLNANLLQVDYRRRLSDKLSNVLLDITRVAGSKHGIVDAKWALKLSEVVSELDPQRGSSLHPSSTYDWDFSARLPGMENAPSTKPNGQARNVCPEMYKFDKKNLPYFQKGMYQESCTYIPKFRNILTVLILSQSWEPKSIHLITNQISKYYDIRIIVLVKNASKFTNSLPTMPTYIQVKKSESDSEAISRAVKLVKTPFVLIGTSLSQFNNQSSLERLVRVLDELPLVKVAGGAARDDQGRWIHGCLQKQMENYHVTYKQGYYSSKYECMFCDDLLTPFVTYTELFGQVPLKKGLSGAIVFHDWFARLRYEGHLAVTCPDVMFYVHTHPIMKTFDWKNFAQIWSLNKIITYDNNTTLEFSCSEANIRCKGIGTLISSFLIPPCCLAKIQNELDYILDYADKNDLHYELQAGSLLGAVKMGSHLRWDSDMDLIFACNDWSKWIQIKDEYLKRRNCLMDIRTNYSFFKIHCPILMYEFICRTKSNTLSRTLMPKEFENVPTKIYFGGRWTSVVSNPGLTNRNRYGLENLRHTPHWSMLKTGNKKAAQQGQYDNPGSWNRCSSPNHHACLDHFPADGSIYFW